METVNLRPREAILEAAIRVLSRNAGATLSEVAETAGVGRATLHRHFANREELLEELEREALQQMERATEGIRHRASSATEAMEQVFEAVVPLGPRLRFLSGVSVDARARAEQARFLGDIIDGMKAEKTVATDLPTSWVIALIEAVIWTAFAQVDEGELARNDAAALAFRSFLRGAGP